MAPSTSHERAERALVGFVYLPRSTYESVLHGMLSSDMLR
jgi:hypothetical protein